MKNTRNKACPDASHSGIYPPMEGLVVVPYKTGRRFIPYTRLYGIPIHRVPYDLWPHDFFTERTCQKSRNYLQYAY